MKEEREVTAGASRAATEKETHRAEGNGNVEGFDRVADRYAIRWVILILSSSDHGAASVGIRGR